VAIEILLWASAVISGILDNMCGRKAPWSANLCIRRADAFAPHSGGLAPLMVALPPTPPPNATKPQKTSPYTITMVPVIGEQLPPAAPVCPGSAFVAWCRRAIAHNRIETRCQTRPPHSEYLAAAGLGLDLRTLAWALAFGACFGG
jgi:hypothetical protein